MIRIAGVNLPEHKSVLIALTYVYGIGLYTSNQILKSASIDHNIKCVNLTRDQVKIIHKIVDANYRVEGNLRSDVMKNIKTLIDIKCYRGIRHIKKLPVRGQRTHTNARTRKGKPVTIPGKKKISN
jgi:small subunit ribosomal protein S13